jgi:chaperonin GroEL
MSRHALLVAVGEYEDPRLNALRAPQQDVTRLAAVLEDPAVGGFDSVRMIVDAPDQVIRRELEDVLSSRSPEDLVLVYFSCHGITTPEQRLFFAASNTVQDRPAGTAVARTFVNELFEDCRAGARVLVLDCCFSGAYGKGIKASLDGVALDDGAVGEGYVVITASDAYEYAFEEERLSLKSPHTSVFTDVMIEGLSSGAADLNGDGWIDARELFDYVHKEVTARRRDQTPKFFAHAADPGIRIARADRTSSVVAHSTKPMYTPEQILVARGFSAAAEPICRTLGPFGRRAVVPGENGRYVELTEASEIASAFRARDPRDEIGASFVRDLVDEVHRRAGDGAATAVVVAQALITNLLDAMRAGAGPVQLMRGLEDVRGLVFEHLETRKVDVSHWGQVAKLAAESSGDPEIGALLGKVAEEVGFSAMIVVTRSRKLGLGLELYPGLRFAGGYVSVQFLTDEVGRLVEFDRPHVLVCQDAISDPYSLRMYMRKVQDWRPVVVIVRDISDRALRAIGIDFNEVSVVVVRAPEEPESLEAIARAVGAQLLDAGSLERADVSALGEVSKVVVSEHETTFLVADSGRNDLPPAVVLTVGALSEPALEDRRRRLERAAFVVSSAVREGVTAGGGATLFRAKNSLDLADPAHVALAGALEQPLRRIAANAGLDPDGLGEPSGGFDAYSGTFVESLTTCGVIESVGVLRVVVDSVVQAARRFLLLG